MNFNVIDERFTKAEEVNLELVQLVAGCNRINVVSQFNVVNRDPIRLRAFIAVRPIRHFAIVAVRVC